MSAPVFAWCAIHLAPEETVENEIARSELPHIIAHATCALATGEHREFHLGVEMPVVSRALDARAPARRDDTVHLTQATVSAQNPDRMTAGHLNPFFRPVEHQ